MGRGVEESVSGIEEWRGPTTPTDVLMVGESAVVCVSILVDDGNTSMGEWVLVVGGEVWSVG